MPYKHANTTFLKTCKWYLEVRSNDTDILERKDMNVKANSYKFRGMLIVTVYLGFEGL